MSIRNYWDLVRELAITDLKLKYKSSVLGYFWSLAKPLLLFTVYYLVFAVFLKLGRGNVNFPQSLILGVVLWIFFAEATMMGMNSLLSKGDLIKKIAFPRFLIPLASSLTALFSLLLNLVAVFFIFAVGGFAISGTIYLFPLVLLELYLLALGLSFILSPLYLRFRDFAHLWEVGLQIIFYLSPIIYPVALVPERFHSLLFLNPIAQIIQDARLTSVDTGTVEPTSRLFTIMLTIAIFVVGLLLFRRSAPKFAEWI
ncbi:MAG: ABC transporter permease [Parcubacteria group bacterium]|nr:ABC transporter permease [Parcubacteria group bacterium]